MPIDPTWTYDSPESRRLDELYFEALDGPFFEPWRDRWRVEPDSDPEEWNWYDICRIETPLDALGCRDAFVVHVASYGDAPARPTPRPDQEVIAVIEAAASAPVYFWSAEMLQVVAANGFPAQRLTINTLLPTPWAFFVLPDPTLIGLPNDTPQGTLLHTTAEGLSLIRACDPRIDAFSCTTFSDGMEAHPNSELAIWLALCSFLNSKYIAHPRVAIVLPRPERRRYQKATGKLYTPPLVHTIHLRAPEPAPHAPSTEERSVEWSRRWLVRGHHHKYRVGKQRQGEIVRWVPPYVKGPADKPFVPPTYAVVR